MSRGRRIGRVKNIPPSPQTAKKYYQHWNSRELYYNIDKFPPITAGTFFNSPGPLHLEIGCGTGEHLTSLAKLNPEHKYLGVDVSRRALFYAIHLSEQSELDNIFFLHLDFKQILPLLQPRSLQAVYLHFPDPNYGGKRNLKKRIVTTNFLDKIALAFTPSGILSIVTDQEPFFFDMLAIIESHPEFVKAHTERYLTDFNPPKKSRFQKAWERMDSPVFRLELQPK